MIAYAKANPGKINVASGGSGTTAHLAIELLKSQAQLDLVHVPYRGLAPALTDIISGQVQMMFGDTLSSLAHVKSGALRPLGGHHRATHRRTARRPNGRGNPARLRSVGMVWHWRAERHASRRSSIASMRK